jgi:WD40 repeat protein
MGHVFISYARADAEPYATWLYDALKAHAVPVWWDRKAMLSRGRTFLQELRDAIAGSDRLLAIVTPDALESDYVAREWEYGRRFAAAVVPVLLDGEFSQLPGRLAKLHGVDFRANRNREDAFAELLRVLTCRVEPLGALLTLVPALPPHFLERTPTVDNVIAALVEGDVRTPGLESHERIVGISGMSGAGKSVIAASVARDADVRRAFFDGVAWLRLGQSPDLASIFRQLGAAFGDDVENYRDVPTAQSQLPEALGDRVCLIVLDDVWDITDLLAIRSALGPRSRLLVTTRDSGLVKSLGAKECPIPLLGEKDSLQLLADWSGNTVLELPEDAISVAYRCGGLPNALAVCGAMCDERQLWSDLLSAFEDADLEFLAAKLPDYQPQSLFAALKLSVDWLSAQNPTGARLYMELAAFRRGSAIPEATVIALWTRDCALSAREARKLLTQLSRRSLLALQVDSNRTAVVLHDLLCDFLQAAASNVRELHAAVLAAYMVAGADPWHAGPNDGYYFENFAYHAAGSGNYELLRDLLFDMKWVWRRIDATSVGSLITDYEYLRDTSAAKLVRQALSQSAILRGEHRGDEWLSQLQGRLVTCRDPAIQSMLEGAAAAVPHPWFRSLNPGLTQASNPVRLRLSGHRDEVQAISVASDGRRVLSGSDDSTLRLWDIRTGELLTVLRGHEGSVYSAVLLPATAVSGDSTGQLILWETEAGTPLARVQANDGAVIDLTVLEREGRILTAGANEPVRLWDVETLALCETLPISVGGVRRIFVLQKEPIGIIAGNDGTLNVWNFETSRIVARLQDMSSEVSALDVDEAAGLVAAGGNEIALWTLPDRKCRWRVPAPSTVYRLWLLPNGGRVLVAPRHGSAVVLSSEDGSVVHELDGGRLFDALPIAGGAMLLTGHNLGTMRVWDSQRFAPKGELRSHLGSVYEIREGAHSVVVTASSDSTLVTWDFASFEPISDPSPHEDILSVAQWFDGGRRALTMCRDGLGIWDVATGTVRRYAEQMRLFQHAQVLDRESVLLVGRLDSTSDGSQLVRWSLSDDTATDMLGEFQNGFLGDIPISPDGRRVFVVNPNHSIQALDLATSEPGTPLVGHTETVVNLAIVDRGRKLVSLAEDDTLRVWDFNTHRCIHCVSLDRISYRIAASLAGTTAVSVAPSGDITIVDVEQGVVRRIEGPSGPVNRILITPSERYAIYNTGPLIVAVDLEQLKVVSRLRLHSGEPVNDIALSSDGRFLCSVGTDERLLLFDFSKHEVVTEFMADEPLNVCAMLSASSMLVAGGMQGGVYLLSVESPGRPV